MRPIALLLLAAAALSAQAPAPAPPPPPSVQTTGEATVTVRPDRARITLGVVSQAANAEEAAAQNAKKLAAVLSGVRAGAPKADVRTTGYSLQPQYRYPRQGAQPEISGYQARNTVEVTTDTIELAGKIVDAAIQSGANNVERMEFTLRDEQPARSEALKQAAAKARANADAIASSLGVRVIRVLRAEEGGAPPIVRTMNRAPTADVSLAAAPTPIEAGTIDVRATVRLVVEVAQ